MTDFEQYSDVELLALLVAAESDDQPLSGQVAVACTVTERLRRRRAHYGLTLRTVMLKPYQYSTFNGDHWRPFRKRIKIYTPLAELAIAGLLRSPAEGATHYHHKDMLVYPKWSEPEHSFFLLEIADHLFYRER